MIWPFLPLIVVYLIVAWAVWQGGISLAGDSPTGRKAAPVVALLWPFAVWFLLFIAIVALVEGAFDQATAWMHGRDG